MRLTRAFSEKEIVGRSQAGKFFGRGVQPRLDTGSPRRSHPRPHDEGVRSGCATGLARDTVGV